MTGSWSSRVANRERRIASYNEEDFTSAIIQLTRKTTKTIYFLLSHGEASLEPSAEKSYSTAKAELEKMGYVVKSLNLAVPEQFPEDIDLLIFPARTMICCLRKWSLSRQYLLSGGRIFFMLDPEVTPGLDGFLAEFGIVLIDDVVVDMVSRKMGGDYFMPVVNEYTPHPITQRFQFATFFPYARSVNVSEAKPSASQLWYWPDPVPIPGRNGRWISQECPSMRPRTRLGLSL